MQSCDFLHCIFRYSDYLIKPHQLYFLSSSLFPQILSQDLIEDLKKKIGVKGGINILQVKKGPRMRTQILIYYFLTRIKTTFFVGPKAEVLYFAYNSQTDWDSQGNHYALTCVCLTCSNYADNKGKKTEMNYLPKEQWILLEF